MTKKDNPRRARLRRHARVRKKMAGVSDRPRLAVFRSLQHIYAQIIDDQAGHTLVAASTLEPAARADVSGSKSEQAERIGRLLAERAREKGVSQVIFDRGGFLYHGRVKSLAEGARAGGLQF
ncbi:MAG TPA: 50S ribosomal protein L18 [Chloroflexota bacterium]|nr:50S ribosomal protein L18 [Chloroflexota bacterium]